MNGSVLAGVIIVTVVMVASVAKAWIRKEQEKPQDDAEIEDTLAKIDQLEERIKVLERIITENRFDLKNEIDSL